MMFILLTIVLQIVYSAEYFVVQYYTTLEKCEIDSQSSRTGWVFLPITNNIYCNKDDTTLHDYPPIKLEVVSDTTFHYWVRCDSQCENCAGRNNRYFDNEYCDYFSAVDAFNTRTFHLESDQQFEFGSDKLVRAIYADSECKTLKKANVTKDSVCDGTETKTCSSGTINYCCSSWPCELSPLVNSSIRLKNFTFICLIIIITILFFFLNYVFWSSTINVYLL
jgi:hypothetical protein